jgi:hypothetical protein
MSSSATNSGKLITDYLRIDNHFMGRNLYILAASLTLFALVSCGVAYTNIAQQPGSPGDASLWRTMGLVLFLIALVVALAGILSSLFEQAERHSEEPRRRKRP